MRFIFSFLVLAILGGVGQLGHARVNRGQSTQALISRPILYKVTAKSGQGAESYILGSQHWDIGLEDLPPWVIAKFDSTAERYFEIDFSNQFLNLKNFLAQPTSPEAFYAVFPEAKGTKKKSDLSPKYISQMVSLGVPLLLAQMTSNEDCQTFEQFHYFSTRKELHSLDAELLLRAQASRSKPFYLETERVRAEADKYAESQGQADSCRITDYLDNKSNLRELNAQFVQMRNHYLSLSPEAFMDSNSKVRPSTKYRNQWWMKSLVPSMRAKSIFVTVGMGHLAGKDGLINLLSEQGFKVTPAN